MVEECCKVVNIAWERASVKDRCKADERGRGGGGLQKFRTVNTGGNFSILIEQLHRLF